jgi:nucleotide-binding universal stress UspA family protein
MESVQVPPGSVVVGVDGSPASARAVLWAADQAGLEHRPVALVSACRATVATTWMGSPGYNPGTLMTVLEDSAREQLAESAKVVHGRDPGLEVYRVFDRRDPRDALLALAPTAAMVVLGTRGHGPMASLLLGSVSLSVSQHAACPVVVVRDDDERTHGGIVVGCDGTVRSDAALGFAFRQASLTSLPLTVVHAFWSEQDEGYPSTNRRYAEADREDMGLLLAEAVAGPMTDYPDVKVSFHVERGLADTVLLHACETADLVVVGTHPTHALYDLLAGEVSRSVLGRAHCPVAVVPDPV